MTETVHIRVSKTDLETFRTTCRQKFIDDNPEYRTKNINDAFLFKRMVRWFIRDPLF